MANHSYVHLNTQITVESAEKRLKDLVSALWGNTLVVERYEVKDKERFAWHVFAPGTELSEETAMEYNKAPDDPFGFLAWYCPSKAFWEFRHPSNPWEWWAQDKLQQTLALSYDIRVFENDGLQEANPDGLKKTYREYIMRNFHKPYNADDLKWLEGRMSYVPEGFRE